MRRGLLQCGVERVAAERTVAGRGDGEDVDAGALPPLKRRRDARVDRIRSLNDPVSNGERFDEDRIARAERAVAAVARASAGREQIVGVEGVHERSQAAAVRGTHRHTPPHGVDAEVAAGFVEEDAVGASQAPALDAAIDLGQRQVLCRPERDIAVYDRPARRVVNRADDRRDALPLGFQTGVGRFGIRQLQTVANTIDQAEVRTRQIERKLKDVEVLPGTEELQEDLQLEEQRIAGIRPVVK